MTKDKMAQIVDEEMKKLSRVIYKGYPGAETLSLNYAWPEAKKRILGVVDELDRLGEVWNMENKR